MENQSLTPSVEFQLYAFFEQIKQQTFRIDKKAKITLNVEMWANYNVFHENSEINWKVWIYDMTSDDRPFEWATAINDIVSFHLYQEPKEKVISILTETIDKILNI